MEPTLVGILLAFLAAFFWACNNVVVREASQYLDPMVGAYLTLWINLAFVSAVSVFFGGWSTLYEAGLGSIGIFVVVGLLQYPIARMAFYFSIQYIGATRAAGITGIQPLITAFLATLILGESMTWRLALGTVLTVAGIYLMEGDRRE